MPAYNIMVRASETAEFEPHPHYGTTFPHFRTDPGQGKVNVLEMWHHSENRCYREGEVKLEVWPDAAWRDRETKRFVRGIYSRLPWDLEPIEDHYAHLSTDNGAMVAYTEDDTKGAVDRQVRIKPGRYLKRFYPHLTSDEIRAYAAQVDKATAVRFAATPEDIEAVYLNGPNSCMSHKLHSYKSPVHPVTVYGNSDLQLAFLSNAEIGHDDFRASARALVWPARKLYGRIYGDETRMVPALEAEGYTQTESFQGAKISRILHDGGYVLPYIDGDHMVRDAGSHLVIDEDGEISAETTTGLTEDNRNYCDYYEEHTNEDTHHIHDLGVNYSDSAISNGHAFYCDGYNRYYSDNVESHDISGSTYSERYLSIYGFYCERSEEWFLDSNDTAVTLEDTNETVALSWAKEETGEDHEDGTPETNAWHDEVSDTWYAERPSEAFLVEKAGQLRLDFDAAVASYETRKESKEFTKGDRVSADYWGKTLVGTVHVNRYEGDTDYLTIIRDDHGTTGQGWEHPDGTHGCWAVLVDKCTLLPPVAPPGIAEGLTAGDLRAIDFSALEVRAWALNAVSFGDLRTPVGTPFTNALPVTASHNWF